MHRYGGVDTSSLSLTGSLSWGYCTALMKGGCQRLQRTSTMTCVKGLALHSDVECCLPRHKLLLHSERHPHVLPVLWE